MKRIINALVTLPVIIVIAASLLVAFAFVEGKVKSSFHLMMASLATPSPGDIIEVIIWMLWAILIAGIFISALASLALFISVVVCGDGFIYNHLKPGDKLISKKTDEMTRLVENDEWIPRWDEVFRSNRIARKPEPCWA